MVVVNGWALYAHPLFCAQLERLSDAVDAARVKDPDGWQSSANAKLLAQINRLMIETIPSDPTRPEFRQGGTLGRDRKHWFRAKFGAGRFRLFFRYSAKARIIVFAWINDSQTLRTYGSKTDAYAMFKSMLDKGNPPDSWEALVAASIRTDQAP